MASRKTLIILCSVAVFVSACVSGASNHVDTATFTEVTPAPTPKVDMSNAESAHKPTLEPRPERPWSDEDTKLFKAWRRLRQASGLKDLERTKLEPQDIEVRVWTVPDLYTPRTKCWHFSRKAGLWNGSAFVDRDFNGRMVRVPLDEPPLSWAKWEAYANQHLSPQSVHEAAKFITPVGDNLVIIVEVKFGNVYERQFLDNDEFLETLFRTIKSEFFKNNDSEWREF